MSRIQDQTRFGRNMSDLDRIMLTCRSCFPTHDADDQTRQQLMELRKIYLIEPFEVLGPETLDLHCSTLETFGILDRDKGDVRNS